MRNSIRRQVDSDPGRPPSSLEEVCLRHRKRPPPSDSLPLATVLPVFAQEPFRSAIGERPLRVHVGVGLDSQVEYEGVGGLVYPVAALAAEYFTLIAIGDRLYSRCHGWDDVAESSAQRITGHGSAQSPWELVTTLEIGPGGLGLVQTDRLIEGQGWYETAIRLENHSPAEIGLQLYRALDCQLPGAVPGYGRVLDRANGAIAYCLNPSGQPAGAAMALAALDPADYLLARAAEVWDAVESLRPLPNRVMENGTGGVPFDAGLALGWALRLAPGEARVVRHLTGFSPTGELGFADPAARDRG